MTYRLTEHGLLLSGLNYESAVFVFLSKPDDQAWVWDEQRSSQRHLREQGIVWYVCMHVFMLLFSKLHAETQC